MSSEFDTAASDVPAQPDLERIDAHDTGGSNATGAAIRIDYDLCEATGVCAELCPEDVIEHVRGHTNVVKPEACTECWICVENCGSGAIEIT